MAAVKRFDGSRVRALREDAGYSREAVALGVRRSWNWLYQVERGELTPSAGALAALAALFDCTIDAFYVEDSAHV
jgi:transcriptional regulator with XRE-family HTH domain